MAYSGVLAAAGLSVGGLAAAAATGPDYAGIALVISAVAGLLSALTAMVIALRKKPGTDAQTAQILQEIADKLTRDEP